MLKTKLSRLIFLGVLAHLGMIILYIYSFGLVGILYVSGIGIGAFTLAWWIGKGK